LSDKVTVRWPCPYFGTALGLRADLARSSKIRAQNLRDLDRPVLTLVVLDDSGKTTPYRQPTPVQRVSES
jgi:hypothetical protein